VTATPVQLPLDLGHRQALGRDDFLVAPCNADATAWIDRWPEWKTLVVHGGAGCGKSHLGAVWQAQADANILLPEHLAANRPEDLAGSGGLILDDADWGFSAAPPAFDQAALLHLYNVHLGLGGSVLITASTPPARWSLSLADLGSRLRAIPAVEIGPPDDALLAAVMVKNFADRQLDVGADVIGFLAARLERSFDAQGRAVNALDAEAMAQGRAITVPLARQVLETLA
jgi:chromosomal replication initiation ATPase DnaA